MLGVGKQNVLDVGQGQITLQQKSKRLKKEHFVQGKEHYT